MHRCLSITINARFYILYSRYSRYSVPGFAVFAGFPTSSVFLREKEFGEARGIYDSVYVNLHAFIRILVCEL